MPIGFGTDKKCNYQKNSIHLLLEDRRPKSGVGSRKMGVLRLVTRNSKLPRTNHQSPLTYHQSLTTISHYSSTIALY